MDQITFEGWLEGLTEKDLLSRQVMLNVLEFDYGDYRARRTDHLLRRAKTLGIAEDVVMDRLYDVEEELVASPDPDKLLAECRKLSLIPLTLGTIRGASYTKTRWVVQDLLPTGLAILAAPPKAKKSWMALDLCLCAAEGRPFLGLPTRKCEVYYLALEDSPQRIKERSDILLGDAPSPAGILFSREAPGLKEGFADALCRHLEDHPKTGLVIVDTLQKVRGVRQSRDVYGSDYADLTVLKRIADRFGVCVLVIHHTTKNQESTDPFALINGSNGVAGTADTELVLTKVRRSDQESLLHITGRDVKERDLRLVFREDSCRWENLGSTEDALAESRRSGLEEDPVYCAAKAIAEEGPWSGPVGRFREKAEELGFTLPKTNLRGLSVSLWKKKDTLKEFAGVQLTRDADGARYTTFSLEKV